MSLFDEICANCGCTFGSHHGGSTSYPKDYCPGHEGQMDWDEGPGTCFKSTGRFKEDETNKIKRMFGKKFYKKIQKTQKSLEEERR